MKLGTVTFQKRLLSRIVEYRQSLGPFDRPARAWLSSRFSIPYTGEEWLLIFPNGARRLITPAELRLGASDHLEG
jgi:hypothetical protein